MTCLPWCPPRAPPNLIDPPYIPPVGLSSHFQTPLEEKSLFFETFSFFARRGSPAGAPLVKDFLREGRRKDSRRPNVYLTFPFPRRFPALDSFFLFFFTPSPVFLERSAARPRGPLLSSGGTYCFKQTLVFLSTSGERKGRPSVLRVPL